MTAIKQIKTINRAMNIIRTCRMNSKIQKTNKKLYSLSYNKSKNNNSTRSNSKSSISKDKKVFVYKSNSGSCNYKNEVSEFSLLGENYNVKNPSNKKNILVYLKNNLIYSKPYMKIDVIEKIVKTFNSDNSFFILFCDKNEEFDKIKLNIDDDKIKLNFRSLMKYYQNQNRFIKLYGDDNAPNVISVKNIDKNNYNIYQIKNVFNKDNSSAIIYEPIDEIKFMKNAVVIFKK